MTVDAATIGLAVAIFSGGGAFSLVLSKIVERGTKMRQIETTAEAKLRSDLLAFCTNLQAQNNQQQVLINALQLENVDCKRETGELRLEIREIRHSLKPLVDVIELPGVSTGRSIVQQLPEQNI